MDYFAFEARLRRLVASASESARFRFAQDSLLLLRRSAADAWNDEELTSEQQILLAQVLDKKNVDSTAELRSKVIRLRSELAEPPSAYLEYLLNAIDHWLDYRATRTPEFVVQIGVDMVNMLDAHIGGDSGRYSTDNMLGARVMREEFHRQAHFLAGQ